MNTTRRTPRIFWLLGILLLVGTAAGARWMLNQAPASDSSTRETDRGELVADMIICLGHVDIERGLVKLHPLQPGRVTGLYVSEGDTVAEGDLLLSVDNQLARAELKRARAGLEVARQDEAKVLMQQRLQKDKIALQENAIAAARANARAAGNELTIQRKMHTEKQLSAELLAVAEEK